MTNRLIPLFDGRPGLRGLIQVEIKTPEIRDNSCNSCLDFVSSDPTLDRYHEIISPAGWKLSTYQKNPVFQNAHQYGDIIFTLGRALITEIRQADSIPQSPIRTPHLYQRIQFAVDANPVAKIAHALYAGRFLNAVSVGFIPIRWEDGTAESTFRRKYLEQELLEVSAVAIPANPNALALAYRSGVLANSDLKDTLDLIRQITSPTRPTSPTSPTLLDLARQFRDLLRS
jgi:hypothetical protein